MQPLPTPSEMATWDRETIETFGIPGVTLMESASREAVDVLLEELGCVDGAEVVCFAGSGNNGGDAFAMARHLLDLGADVTVYHTRPKKQYRGESRTNLQWASKLGIPLKHLSGIDITTLPQPDIVVDGVLGTGFEGTLRKETKDLIEAMNRFGRHAFVLAIDIPSGLNGFSGNPQPIAVQADVTVTFQAPKLGLAMPEAAQYTGMVHIRPIGIPQAIQQAHPTRHQLITRDVLGSLPARSPAMHKGTAGRVLIIGGSPGLTGAPHLTALGALRSGAGLVTVACPARLADAVKADSPEIMTLPLGDGEAWTPSMIAPLLDATERYDAIVVGPGMGREAKTVDFLRAFVAHCPAHAVLDADALYGLAQFPEALASLPETAILTPHPGEMARLLGTTTADIQADRLNATEALVSRTPATLILKGAGTLVANRTGIRISPFAEPNLAVGGSGDVLGGVVASLAGQGMPTLTAATLGVCWHGLAGRLLRKDFPARGNLASEIANALPRAIQHIEKENASC